MIHLTAVAHDPHVTRNELITAYRAVLADVQERGDWTAAVVVAGRLRQLEGGPAQVAQDLPLLKHGEA